MSCVEGLPSQELSLPGSINGIMQQEGVDFDEAVRLQSERLDSYRTAAAAIINASVEDLSQMSPEAVNREIRRKTQGRDFRPPIYMTV